jgi:hypothetical protein
MPPEIVLVDRSRMDSFQTCPRLRFLTYHYEGRGIVPRTDAYALSFGSLYHEGLEALTLRRAPDDQIIAELTKKLALVIENMNPQDLPHLLYGDEQRYLLAGLLWSWTRVKRPELERDYLVKGLEQEFLWTLGTLKGITIVDMVRLDAILQDRATDTVYYKEHKTTAWGDARWAQYFEHNGQVLANLSALEEALGERPGGILIEGHLKGPTRRDTARASRMNGMLIQDSPLTYVYQKGLGDITLEWRYGAARVPVAETGFSPKQWALEYLSEEDCRKLFVQLPPISPDPAHVARWRRQTLRREVRIAQALAALPRADEPADILDEVFPLSEASCIQYGRKCSHYAICHDPTVAAEPLGSGLFQIRKPNHPAELTAPAFEGEP